MSVIFKSETAIREDSLSKIIPANIIADYFNFELSDIEIRILNGGIRDVAEVIKQTILGTQANKYKLEKAMLCHLFYHQSKGTLQNCSEELINSGLAGSYEKTYRFLLALVKDSEIHYVIERVKAKEHKFICSSPWLSGVNKHIERASGREAKETFIASIAPNKPKKIKNTDNSRMNDDNSESSWLQFMFDHIETAEFYAVVLVVSIAMIALTANPGLIALGGAMMLVSLSGCVHCLFYPDRDHKRQGDDIKGNTFLNPWK